MSRWKGADTTAGLEGVCAEVYTRGVGEWMCMLDLDHEGPHGGQPEPEPMNTHDVLKVLLVTSGVLATAGNAYHVIAAHQMSEADCRWPVCSNVRENREEIHALVEKLKAEELAT